MAATRIGVVLSGTGRTLVNILEHIRDGKLDAEVVCVISDREGVRGVGYDVELVCLCGYLRLLKIPDSHRRRVLNIHPALLPKFGGEGFYGHRVHDAVLAASESESGCTVHYCDNEYDRGAILLQKRVPVLEDDTADTLAARVFDAECVAYPEAIKIWAATQ